MKKEEAIDGLERAGQTINELYAKAWATALYPTQHGWGPSIASMGAIPLLSVASIGQMVSAAIVDQVPADVFDRLSSIGKPREP